MFTVAHKSAHMPSYQREPYGTYSSSTRNYSTGTVPRYTSSVRSSGYGSSHLYGQDNVYSKPPISSRTLPSGPGPLDKYGKKQTHSDVRSLLRNTSSRSTSTVTKPLKADYSSSYASSYARRSAGYSSRDSSVPGVHSKLNRESISPARATLRNRTSSTHDLPENLRNLEINDSGSTTSLQRSRNYGSLSNVSVSSRRSSFDHSNDVDSYTNKSMYSSRYRNRNYSSSDPPTELYNHHDREKSPKERITANLTPEKMSPVYSRSSKVKEQHYESNESSPSPSFTTSPSYDTNNNSNSPNKVTADHKNGGKIGLANLGNTCFMNCVLQCLSNTRPLLEFCINDKHKTQTNKKTKSKGALISAYVSLMKNMWNTSRSSVSPTEFKSQIEKFAPRFGGYNQQDAQEFLRYLLQGLHEDINRVQGAPKPPPVNEDEINRMSDDEQATFFWNRYLKFDSSFIVDLFVGQLKSTLTCTTCHHESVTFDPFWDLSLPIPKRSTNTDIHDCLNLFMQEEILDGDERPKCEKCKVHRRCTKSFRIQRFPQVLVLHLKRFSGERFRSKLSTLIKYPVTGLNLAEFAAGRGGSKAVYNLYGVSNHSGSVYSGHYTAYAKHAYNGHWISASDAHVRDCSQSTVVSAEGYVLFYERVGETHSHL